MPRRYNGHPSWRLWNLALWMANDEGLYWMAKRTIQRTRNRDEAARVLMDELHGTATPDGAKWTESGVRYAIRGL